MDFLVNILVNLIGYIWNTKTDAVIFFFAKRQSYDEVILVSFNVNAKYSTSTEDNESDRYISVCTMLWWTCRAFNFFYKPGL